MKTTRSRTSALLTLAVVAMATFTFTAKAATISTSTTAPIVDADDVANNLTYGDATGETNSFKWFSDVEHNGGQTFTPTVTAQLNSFTVRLHASNQDEGGEWVDVRLGAITRPGGVFTFTDIYNETANMNGDWNPLDYLTFAFDTPQTLTAGTEYGVIIDAHNFGDWHNGIPYLKSPGGYAGGSRIGRGAEQSNTDLSFEADLSVAVADDVPEPATMALLGLAACGLGGYVRRRRKA